MQPTPTTPTSRASWRRPVTRRGWLLSACLTGALGLATTLTALSSQPSPAPRRAPQSVNAVATSAAPARGNETVQPTAVRTAVGWPATPVIAAAGDIACDPSSTGYHGGRGVANGCHMRATAELLLKLNPIVVLTLGDNSYENGTLAKFRRSYDPTWGQLKQRTRPAVGNHEYGTRGAAGYFDYFGAAAGSRSKGYYSFEVGAWHLIALNSECTQVGGCGKGSAQERWLRADLAAHPARCTLAYWHKPRFSSGLHGDDAAYDAFWRALYEFRADVVLNGHDHDYERFAPQTPDAAADAARGVREFVVGTGGKSHYGFRTIRRNSQVRNAGAFGVLKLRLGPSGYDWRFLPEPGKAFTDSGHDRCH